MADFLFEIGLEEIPARMIAAAQDELTQRVFDLLTREHLLEDGQKPRSYSTPRRLAVLVGGVRDAQTDAEENLTGPAWNIAFKNGEPGPAAQAFAKKAGVAVTDLKKVQTPKGEYVGASTVRKGRAATEILAEALPKELTAIYWPKNMYWREGKPERFVRPVQWMVALLDEAVIPVEFAGINAGRATYGHRILHGSKPVEIAKPSDYLNKLEAAKVLADVEVRRHKIRKALDHATRKVESARWREDEPLVDTVTHLTEWPSVVLGGFEQEYLALPEEVLVTVMRDHQKYFAVEDANGKLAPHFLTVLNTEPGDEAAAIIQHGNERVLRARFNDAQFFWTVDQKTSLADRVEMLKTVTFHKELGSYWDKMQANIRLAREFGNWLSVYVTQPTTCGPVPDMKALETAAKFAKVDLTTELVKEFTELQGVIGGLYARAQGLSDKVADAIEWQYRPANVEDKIPPTIEGQLFGLADRIHTIVAMFYIGNAPTGSKDPFGLRRAANAVVKILAESELPFDLERLCRPAIDELQNSIVNSHQANLSFAGLSSILMVFFRERLEFYLRDVCGAAYDVVNAVLAAEVYDTDGKLQSWGYEDVRDAIARVQAVSAMRGSEDFEAIAAAFKRMKNIVRQAEDKGQFTFVPGSGADPQLLREPAEKDLYRRAFEIGAEFQNLRQTRKYREALEHMATLRPDVDKFFDKVMVMVEDDKLRRNRLALIQFVLHSFSSIADFSEIVVN